MKYCNPGDNLQDASSFHGKMDGFLQMLHCSNPDQIFPHHSLVGGLEHFLFSHIFGIIIPTDFHIFQRGSNHQPVQIPGRKKEAFWGLLLPVTVHGRVSDIWRAYLTQKLLWDATWAGGDGSFTHFGAPNWSQNEDEIECHDILMIIPCPQKIG